MDDLFFGVSCAFFALNLLPEPDGDGDKFAGVRTRLLKGTAHLLGLLVWKIQTGETLTGKLEHAQKQIEHLKHIRSQDGKANERVVAIVAAREQIYLDERRKLRQQIEKSNRRFSEIEENLKESENLVHDLRQRHSHEILKHKKAFVELVSNQRQLEAEMGRAMKQLESAKRELESAQRLAMEVAKLRGDLEQKDRVLSAMLRKSKLDCSEKEVLRKEVKKASKAMRKQAEIEMTSQKRSHSSLRNMLSRHVNGKSDVFLGGKGFDGLSLASDSYSSDDGSEEQKIGSPHAEHLEDQITSEISAYKTTTDQRHNLEIDAFAEQLRQKDENLETLRWRLMSMDIESKRLHSHIEDLDREITNLKHENMNLEAQLTDGQSELHSLKEQLILQFNPPNLQKLQLSPSPDVQKLQLSPSPDVNHETVWSKVKVIKRKPGQKMEDEKMSEITENEQQHKDIVLTLQYPLRKEKSIGSGDLVISQESTKKSNSTMKIDIQALGVSYKIKRLKQQFLMLERMIGKQESSREGENENDLFGIKGFYDLISLLNRQVDRYQSLQEKTDDLCQRMDKNNLNLNLDSTIAKTPDETKWMRQFLDETFQLQRYMVATGQKLTEVQARITSGFVVDVEETEKPLSFDVKRFADSIRTLFQEVQRGLEMRLSRIIGDLEGTLACDGIIHFKKQF